MCITGNVEEAKCFETFASLLGDEKKAIKLISDLGFDGKTPVPYYANAIYAATGKSNEEICSVYKSISEAFDSERIDYSILSYANPMFPNNKSIEPVYFLYAAGKKELLLKQRVTCIGSPMPSIQGKSGMASAVEKIIDSGAVVMAPLDSGLGAFALSIALSKGGGAIGVLPGPLSKCPNSLLIELMGALYENGLLLSQFAPSVKSQKWHIVLRNRFLGGISDSVYLPEDKDGGPSWAIFDSALEHGAKAMIAKALVENPNQHWAKERIKAGALIERASRDISRFLLSKRKESGFDDLTPDLFS